jgi:hypothetical protein
MIKEIYFYNDIQLAYIAGFFDGEGYIGVSERHDQHAAVQLRIEVINTDRSPLLFIIRVFGGNIQRRANTRAHCKPIYRWNLTGVPAAFALSDMLPYLTCKKERAKLGIECMHTTNIRRQLEIVDELRILNKKGVVAE